MHLIDWDLSGVRMEILDLAALFCADFENCLEGNIFYFTSPHSIKVVIVFEAVLYLSPLHTCA